MGRQPAVRRMAAKSAGTLSPTAGSSATSVVRVFTPRLSPFACLYFSRSVFQQRHKIDREKRVTILSAIEDDKKYPTTF